MKATLITTAVVLAAASTAQAGEYKTKSQAKTTPAVQAQTVVAERQDGEMVTIAGEQTVVLGTVAVNGNTLYAVPAEGQGVVYNWVPRSIEPVTTNVDEVDTYTYEYRGMTFTNRVVDGFKRG